MTNSPLISVIMPTYNSEGTIGLVLESIKRQSYKYYEILVIDGGSTDETINIALKYGCKILENPNKLPEYAKHIGLLNAVGKYAVFLDSDEVLLDCSSWEKKVGFLESNKFSVKNFITAGLLNPDNYSWINGYINKIGDPFNFRLYRNEGDNFKKSFLKKYNLIHNEDGILVFEFQHKDMLPICDGGGHFFDLSYLRSICDLDDIFVVTNVFKFMEKETHQIALIESDFIEHYSVSSVAGYLKKIDWRIINNIHYSNEKLAGYVNRESGFSFQFLFKKYFFMIYVFTFLWPIRDSFLRIKGTGQIRYIYHTYFCFYTAIKIIIEYIKKIFGIKTTIPLYGK